VVRLLFFLISGSKWIVYRHSSLRTT
jgi:hypothetical protein